MRMRWGFSFTCRRGADVVDGTPHHSRHVGSIAVPLVTTCGAMLIIALIFWGGVRRGMDHVAAYGPESEQTAISIALSESIYGLRLGYLGFATVKRKLQEIWNSGAAYLNDPILIKNNADRNLLNQAITAAASLGPQEPGFLSDRTLITTVYDDMGYVDYVKLSFRLFGLRIESMYYTFFVLIGISALVFIVNFRESLSAQVVLLCALFAFYVELHTAIFIPDMPTLTGMRHSSSLALLPMWHFIFLIVLRRRLTIGSIVSALIQLAILILAIRIRGSAGWTVLFAVAVGLARALASWWEQDRESHSLVRLAHEAASWPVIVLVVGVLANSVYSRVVLHPIYFTDDVIPYHGPWHSAVLGLSYDPELYSAPAAKMLREGANTDEVGYYEALDYLRRIRFIAPNPNPGESPAGFVSPWTGTIKFRLHDSIMRAVFFDIMRHHPLRVAWIYAYEKPRSIYFTLRLIFSRTETSTWLFLMIGFGVIVGLLMMLSGVLVPKDLGAILLVGAAAVISSGLPNLWAYPSFHTVSDHFLVVLAFGQLLVGSFIAIGLGCGLQVAKRRWRARASD